MSDWMTREEAQTYADETVTRVAGVSGALLKQKRYLAKNYLTPVPCPNCLAPLALVDAVHVEDPDTNDRFDCPHCGAKLLHTVPLVHLAGPIWSWSLLPHQIPVRVPDKAQA